MKSFLLKCIVFMIPIAALFAFPFTAFLLSGEFLSARSVVERQNKSAQDIIYMSAFTGINEKAYKIMQAIEHDPEITVFGRSRTLTLRSDFFKDPATFYNSGVPMHQVSELRDFLAHIPQEAKLKVILLDLSNFLRDDPAPQSTIQGGEMLSGVRLFLTSGWREAYISYLHNKFTLTGIVAERSRLPSIGLNALVHHEGYRKDGSLSRGNATDVAALMAKIPGALQAVTSTTSAASELASFDSVIAPENLVEIGAFLEAAHARDIYVIGYLSPYALEVYQKLQSLPGERGKTIRSVPSQLTNLFSDHSYHFYDLRDIRSIGSSDKELYDLGHPTEKATMKLLNKIANSEPKLRPYVNPALFPELE